MSFLTKNLRQQITLWRQAAAKDDYGNLTYSAPTVIKGRWEERAVLRTDLDGREIVANAMVFLVVDVKKGDYLFLGVDTTASPVTVDGANEIQDFKKTPSLNGRRFERVAIL